MKTEGNRTQNENSHNKENPMISDKRRNHGGGSSLLLITELEGFEPSSAGYKLKGLIQFKPPQKASV